MAYFADAAAQRNYLDGQTYALNQLGRRYRFLSKFNKALTLHKDALEIAKKADNIEFKVFSLNMIAVVYRRIDAITAALDHNQQALELAQSVEKPDIGIKRGINISLNGIGNIYRKLAQYDLAIEQFKRAMKLEEALDNKLGLAINHQNIGECQEAQGNLKEALESYDRSMAYNLELDNIRGQIFCKNGIAHVYIHEGRADEAVAILEQALKASEGLGNKSIVSSVHITMGWALTELERYEEAEDHLLEGLSIAEEYNFISGIAEAYTFLSDLYTAQGDYQKALVFYKLALSFQSKVRNNKNIRYVYDMIIKKDSQEVISNFQQDAHKKNTTLLISGIVLALLAGIFYILYRQYQLKNDKKLLTLEQSMLRSQMNPHFLFNSLNSIKLYIINNEQKNAVHYLNKFSKLVRKILESSSMREIPLAEELETVELYMNIENIRFSNEIDFRVRVDDDIDPHTIKIPSLILQPFLENALWHGLSSKTGEKKIGLHVSKDHNDFIHIAITDNGIGRAAAEKIKQNKVLKRKSVGIEITKERLKNFSKDFQNSFDVEFVDLYDADENSIGTKVVLHIPTA